MTDKLKVYTKVMQKLKKMMPTTPQNQMVALAMMVGGIVLSRKAQLSVISLKIPHPAKPASLEKRLHRFVKNERCDVQASYLPFAHLILSHLANKPLILAMDGSTVGRGCMTLMVGVIYRKQAIPLAWIVYRGKKGHTTAAHHITVLEQLMPLLPKVAEVILLGDSEYDAVEMLNWVTDCTDWRYVVRTSTSNLITHNTHNSQQYALRDLCGGHGSITSVHEVLFIQQEFGPVMAVACWGKNMMNRFFSFLIAPQLTQLAPIINVAFEWKPSFQTIKVVASILKKAICLTPNN